MKKIVALGLATALFTSTALAGTASAPITVNATVLSSCMFDSTATGSASFSYDAATGAADVESGTATLYCNSGTPVTLKTALTGDLVLSSASKSTSLDATYTLTSVPTPGAGTDAFAGADKYVYTVAPKAAKGQWGAASAADYKGTVEINVTF